MCGAHVESRGVSAFSDLPHSHSPYRQAAATDGPAVAIVSTPRKRQLPDSTDNEAVAYKQSEASAAPTSSEDAVNNEEESEATEEERIPTRVNPFDIGQGPVRSFPSSRLFEALMFFLLSLLPSRPHRSHSLRTKRCISYSSKRSSRHGELASSSARETRSGCRSTLAAVVATATMRISPAVAVALVSVSSTWTAPVRLTTPNRITFTITA